MSVIQFLTYAGVIVFVVAFALRLIKYFTLPMHVRWELYPIPHEGKEWGGSFYEEIDHWKKERHVNHFNQYAFMVPEILFIRALKEDNPGLWYWSFPFHLGLYICIAGLVFLAVTAILQIAGLTEQSAIFSLTQSLTVVFGMVGFVLGSIGAIGLFIKRVFDRELSEFSAPIDYMNLIWLAAIFVTGILVWRVDPKFALSREFMVSLLTFQAAPDLHVIQIINLLLFVGFVAYFPFTHMTHMVSKYFMWDKVKWDDKPNVGDPTMDAKIKEYLGYPVHWSADHVQAEGGKKTWVDVATSNPWANEEGK
jgi:nitrate reductase gamma subunit